MAIEKFVRVRLRLHQSLLFVCSIFLGNVLCLNTAYAGKAPLIETDVLSIQVQADKLYNILLEFDEYALWNPWLYEAVGQSEIGGHVLAKLTLDGREVESDHIITQLVQSEVFCWRDEMWYSFMAGGQRCRYLEQQTDGSTLVKGTFQFNGWFAGMGYLIYKNQMLEGMSSELVALKAYAEAGL